MQNICIGDTQVWIAKQEKCISAQGPDSPRNEGVSIGLWFVNLHKFTEAQYQLLVHHYYLNQKPCVDDTFVLVYVA